MAPNLDKPLFIPLRREWFDAFRRGDKQHEWRRYGPRWNAASCCVGRRVTLSLGYSSTQLYGVVVSFETRRANKGAAALYGVGTLCAVIGIRLD